MSAEWCQDDGFERKLAATSPVFDQSFALRAWRESARLRWVTRMNTHFLKALMLGSPEDSIPTGGD